MAGRRVVGIILAALILTATAFIAGGCAKQVLYGTWQLKYTSFSDGSEQSEPEFPTIVDIRENGEVYMYDVLLGYYTRDRNTFTFRYAEDEEPWLTGAFKVEGTKMYVYADGSDIMYTLIRVETSQSK